MHTAFRRLWCAWKRDGKERLKPYYPNVMLKGLNLFYNHGEQMNVFKLMGNKFKNYSFGGKSDSMLRYLLKGRETQLGTSNWMAGKRYDIFTVCSVAFKSH